LDILASTLKISGGDDYCASNSLRGFRPLELDARSLTGYLIQLLRTTSFLMLPSALI
jgi:hypothetical protein